MDMALSKGLDPTQDTALDCCPLRFWVFPLKAWSKGSRLRVTCTNAVFQNIKQVDNHDRYTPEAKYSTSRFGRHKCFSLTAIRILRRIMIDESEILHWVWNDQTKQCKFCGYGNNYLFVKSNYRIFSTAGPFRAKII